MYCLSLLQSRTQGPVQPCLKIQLSLPGHHMGKQISIEGGVFVEESIKLQIESRRGELRQMNLLG